MARSKQRGKRPLHELVDKFGEEVEAAIRADKLPWGSKHGPNVAQNDMNVLPEMIPAMGQPIFIADGIEDFLDTSLITKMVTVPPIENCTVELLLDDWTKNDPLCVNEKKMFTRFLDTDGNPYDRWIIFVRKLDETTANESAIDPTAPDMSYGFGTVCMSKHGMLVGIIGGASYNKDGTVRAMRIEKDRADRIRADSDDETAQCYEDIGKAGLALANFVFGLLHTRNVSTKPRKATEFERKLCKKRGRKPVTTYKTLVVKPLKSKEHQPVTYDRTTESGMSHHMCRGHFRHYTKETGLLFGKIEGTFWIPQHFRGDKKHGKVVKDYEIRT
jgi:hypothetical protein